VTAPATKGTPSSYWLVICVHNHGDHPIDEWEIELESSSTLQILETGIEGSNVPVHLQISNLKAQRAERMCKNIVDVWTMEVLLVPRC